MKSDQQQNNQQKTEEWYDEVYFDSEQDSEEEQEDKSPGIGLMGKQKKKPSKVAERLLITVHDLTYFSCSDQTQKEGHKQRRVTIRS
jgi:hypothetical protein